MGICELCGKSGALLRAAIEGIPMDVCSGCGSFGRVITSQQKTPVKTKAMQLPPELESSEAVVANFAQIVRRERERRALTQEDFAKALNEKISVIHKIEVGLHEPSIPLARKLEKSLGIKLVEYVKELPVPSESPKGNITIGDIIKLK